MVSRDGATVRSIRAQTDGYTGKMEAALAEAKVTREKINEILDLGFSDFCLPMPSNYFPVSLRPSQHASLEKKQLQFLDPQFEVGPQDQWPGNHLNLNQDAINRDSQIPKTLQYKRNITSKEHTEVTVMECPSGGIYVLKRIERIDHGARLLEQMNYINGELSILRKIRTDKVRHFVELVGSYTEMRYIGMITTPKADCDLATYLENFNKSGQNRNLGLLKSFFGCLATALVYLHFVVRIRHKDIKPQNILVKDNNVLFTDFGTALDWSLTGQTTTDDEVRRTLQYCAPEVDAYKKRNTMSDIWSLGCVFMEMIAVLKGKTRAFVFEALGDLTCPRFCRSITGITTLLQDLRKIQPEYNSPLDWIEKMLKEDPEARPPATNLRSMISQTDGSDYFGICCRNKSLLQPNPPIQTRLPTTAKLFLGINIGWCDIIVIEDTSLPKNWISCHVVAQSHLQQHDNATPQFFKLDGHKFESTHYIKNASFTIENANSTLYEGFLVSTKRMPYDAVVTSATFEVLRALLDNINDNF